MSNRLFDCCRARIAIDKMPSSALIIVALMRLRTKDGNRKPTDHPHGETIDSGRAYPDRWNEKALELVAFDPLRDWAAETLDIQMVDSSASSELLGDGEFICATLLDRGALNDPTFVCAITYRSGLIRLASLRRGTDGWISQIIWESHNEMLNFVRSISAGDVDEDGDAEIVIGTKPNGVVLLLDKSTNGYSETYLDQNSHGVGSTNTREVLIADVDNDGSLEVIATNAYASDAAKWAATPGSITVYKRHGRTWQRRVIEDFSGETHSRMFVVGDVLGTGENQLVANVVGVFDQVSRSVDPPSMLTLYHNIGSSVRSHIIDTLESAVKARGLAIANIYGDGRRSLIVGTRGLDLDGYRRSHLLCYWFDESAGSWFSEEIDRSGETGFHTVAAVDVDNDGREEIIASDDERGLIKCYKRSPLGWHTTIVHDAGSRIFVASIFGVSIS
jgi:FG-GAP-like repeat